MDFSEDFDKIDTINKREVSEERMANNNIGYLNHPLSVLSNKGIFYPSNTRLQIRSATVEEIAHWSTIDDVDILEQTEIFKLILEKCVLYVGNGERLSYKDIFFSDLYALIFAIRDLTFPNKQNTIKFKEVCSSCQKANEIELTHDVIQFNQIDERFLKMYDYDKKCFVFESPKIGKMQFYVPTIGTEFTLKNIFFRYKREGKSLSNHAIKLLPFIVKNWAEIDSTSNLYRHLKKESEKQRAVDMAIKRYEMEIASWSYEQISLATSFVDKFDLSMKYTIDSQCGGCGSNITFPFQFPNGLRDIFIIPNILDEFLSI